MCVSTFQVEFVLRELSCFILLPQSRYSGVWETSQFWKELSCFLAVTRADGIENRLGLLAYRIVVNCTTVLKLVSTFQLACSSHRQETNDRFHIVSEKWITLIVRKSASIGYITISSTSQLWLKSFSTLHFDFHFCNPYLKTTSKTSPLHTLANPAIPGRRKEEETNHWLLVEKFHSAATFPLFIYFFYFFFPTKIISISQQYVFKYHTKW